jgi:hypothetical protein
MNDLITELRTLKQNILDDTDSPQWDSEALDGLDRNDIVMPYLNRLSWEAETIFIKAHRQITGKPVNCIFPSTHLNYPFTTLLEVLQLAERYARNWNFS